MPRTSAETLLEVVPVPWTPDQPPPAGDTTRRRRVPRWVAAGAIALLILAGAALPVRSTVAVNEWHSLARRWSWYQSIDGQRGQLDAQMAGEAQDPTDPEVLQGAAALAGEELPLLLAARARILAGWHLPDGGLSQLRRGIAEVFADQADDLSALVASHWPAPAPRGRQSTQAATDLVDRLLGAEQAHWHQQPVRAVVAPPLQAAATELAHLAMPSDQPIAARLVLVGSKAVASVDLGAGHGRSAVSVDQGSNVLSAPVVPRAGYLAVAATGPFPDQANVYAVNPDLAGPPRVIGSTYLDVVVAAADPQGVWLQSGSDAIEVNGAGAVLHGAVPLGLGRILIGATDRVLVTSGLVTSVPSAELQVVPIDGPEVGRASDLTTRGELVAAAPGHLAWLDTIAGGAVVLRLAGGDAQGIRTIPPGPSTSPTASAGVPAGAVPVDSGAFSPDGSLLVVRYLTAGGGADALRLGLVDVATDTVRLIDGSIGDHPAGTIVWSPTGNRVFFAEAVASQLRSRIATWALDSPRPTVVRVAAPDLLDLTVTAG